MLETLDHTIRIGSIPTFLYFSYIIDLFEKWLPFHYSFICILNNLNSLVYVSAIQKNLWFMTRLVRLI